MVETLFEDSNFYAIANKRAVVFKRNRGSIVDDFPPLLNYLILFTACLIAWQKFIGISSPTVLTVILVMSKMAP